MCHEKVCYLLKIMIGCVKRRYVYYLPSRIMHCTRCVSDHRQLLFHFNHMQQFYLNVLVNRNKREFLTSIWLVDQVVLPVVVFCDDVTVMNGMDAEDSSR